MAPARAVILSPHLDDAVLSCWHVLEGPGEVVVLNVFAGVPTGPPGWWDRLTGAKDAAQRMAERHEEDRRALAAAGRDGESLGFLDAQYRQNGGPPPAELASALRPHLRPDDLVYAPVTEGEHPDHRLVREAALALRGEVAELRLYDDLPHALNAGRRAPHEPAGLRPEVHLLDPEALRRKLTAVRLYRSQVAALDAAAPAPGWLEQECVWRR
jgi:LmbE family N-acetylglucosaminyl deacetylase